MLRDQMALSGNRILEISEENVIYPAFNYKTSTAGELEFGVFFSSVLKRTYEIRDEFSYLFI